MPLAHKITSAKPRLKRTETTVTQADGKVFTECLETGVIKSAVGVKAAGFVTDTKPDLNLSLILPGLFLSSQDVAASPEILRHYRFRFFFI